MKISWVSNAPWTKTGYGQQTSIFAPRLNEHFDVAITASWGFGGDKTIWQGMPVYPQGFDAYGNDVMVGWALDHFGGDRNAGWLVILYDAWVFANEEIGTLHNAVWVPVDHDPLPPPVYAYFKKMNGLPLAMSRFGQEKFAQVDIEALYVPHAVHPAYKPKPKAEGREALGIPEDAFVVGMNAANKGNEMHRKGFSQAFEGFTRFAKDRSDAILYVHSEETGFQGTVGWDLRRLADIYGILDKVRFADQHVYKTGIATEAMPYLYSSFDVFLNPAYGEGFGIPIIEAQACGVPVVVTNHTAMKEICGDGWAVGGINMYHEKMASFWKIPDPNQIADALKEATDRTGPSQKAVDFAAHYHADTVFDQFMLPAFQSMEERINPRAAA